MWKDPIVAEVRSARETIAKEFGYDLDRMMTHFRAGDLAKKKSKTRARPSADKPSGPVGKRRPSRKPGKR